MKKEILIKRITLAIILACIFALVVCCFSGCENNNKKTTAKTTATTTTQAPPDDDPPVHSHTVFIDEAVESTCTSTGLTEGKHCSECGEILVAQEETPKKAHTEEIIPAVESTCTEKGLTEGKKCSACGEILVVQQEAPLKAHTEETIPAVEATCAKTGLTEGKKCSACGEILVAQSTAPLKEHTYDGNTDLICNACGYERACEHASTKVLASVEATCTSTGLTEGKQCTVCNEILVAQTVVALKNHTEVVDAKVEATCTSTGLTEGKHCSVCGKVLVAQNVVSMKSHTEVIDPAIEATCISTGLTEGKHCSVCFAVLVEQTSVPTLDHKESDWIVGRQPTENGVGQKYTKCETCGQILNSVEIPATHAHNYTDWIEVQSAGCSAFSYSFRICLDCGDQVIDAPEGSDIVHPHEFEKITKQPTCTEDGIEYRFECKNCHFVAGEKKLSALGHALQGNTYKQLNDTYHTQTCSRCGEEVKEAHSHTNFTQIDAPTCEENGKAVGQCDKCGHDGDKVILALGHLFIGDCTYVDEDYHLRECERCDKMIYQSHTVLTWTTTVESTCTTTGRQEGNCASCGGHTSRTTSENHNFRFVSFTAGSSCMDGGSATYTCSKCGATRTIDLLAPGHDYVYSHTVTEPTCTTSGSAIKVCSRCGVEQEYTLYALGHSYSGGVTIKAATCYQNGTVRFTCQREGCSAIRESTIQKSHNFDSGVVTVAPTCSSKGEIVYTCRSCNVTVEYVLPVVHDLTYHSYKGATCTESGHTSYYTCNGCGQYFSGYYSSTVYLQCDGRSYSSRNHSITTYISTSHQNTIINALGHSYTSYYNKYDSNNHYRYCTRGCGTLLESGKHTLIEKWEVVTERVSGGYEYYLLHRWDCSKCGYYAYGEKQSNGTILDPVDPIKISEEHNSFKVIQPTYPTCTESGLDVGLVCATCGKVIWAQETLPALGHNFIGGTCTRCGLTDGTPASEGLEFALNSDGQSYYVKGIGTCTDTDVVIPDTYNGLPVTKIGNSAFKNCTSLTSVSIPNSVMTISAYAFYGCRYITGVIIPNSITCIQNNAFTNCEALTNVRIPDSVTTIEIGAFSSCNSLENISLGKGLKYIQSQAFSSCAITSIEIPNSVVSIGWQAFYNCESLTYISIPASVTSIGSDPFTYCTNLETIDVDIDNKYYKSIDGVLYTKDGKELIQYPAYKNNNFFVVPDSVTSIGSHAFCESQFLERVVIPDSVTSIGSYAFGGCGLLTEIEISNSVAIIDSGTFQYCYSLTNVTIPNSVTRIEYMAFAYCTSLKSITIPNSVKSIGEWAFISCRSLEKVNIPETITSVGDEAFYYCSSLELNEYKDAYYLGNDDNPHLVLIEAKNKNAVYYETHPNTKVIADYAFSDFIELTEITIGNSVTNIGNYTFKGCKSLTDVVMPNSLVGIGDSAFNGCTLLTSITIPDSVTSIGEWAFSNCELLKYNEYDNAYYLGNEGNPYVVIIQAKSGDIVNCEIHPDTKVIGDRAFGACAKLKSIIIPDSVISIGNTAFGWCDYLENVTIGKSVMYIGDSAFWCTRVSDIVIPQSVTSMGSYVFHGSNAKIYCEAESQPMGWDSNWNSQAASENSKKAVVWGYQASGTTSNGLIWYQSNDEISIYEYSGTNSTIEIPSIINEKPVSSISDDAFQYSYSLQCITIPASVKSIGDYAFSDCGSLTSICVDENNEHYKSIDGNLYTKDGKTLIQYAIGKKSTSFIIPNSVTSIGEWAFSECSSLTSVHIPASVTIIGNSAFRFCDSLITITIPSSVMSIGDYAFRYCDSLTSICVDENNEYYKSIDGNLYTKDGKTLIQYAIGKKSTSFIIPDSVTSIYYYAFEWCHSLTSVTIPNSVTSIGEWAFRGCNALTSVTIGNSVTSIGNYAFADCSSLASITIPDSVTSIGSYAFNGCKSLTIYCEVAYTQSGWNSNWNSSNRPVVWGYKPEQNN